MRYLNATLLVLLSLASSPAPAQMEWLPELNPGGSSGAQSAPKPADAAPSRYSEALARDGAPNEALFAAGGEYFLTARRRKSAPATLRLWRVSGGDAQLVGETLQKLYGNKTLYQQAALTADGTQVAFDTFERRAFGEDGPVLQIWRAGDNRRETLALDALRKGHTSCGVVYAGTDPVICSRPNATQDAPVLTRLRAGKAAERRELPAGGEIWPKRLYPFGPDTVEVWSEVNTGDGGSAYQLSLTNLSDGGSTTYNTVIGPRYLGYLADGRRMLVRSWKTLAVYPAQRESPLAESEYRTLSGLHYIRPLLPGPHQVMFALNRDQGIEAYAAADRAIGLADRLEDPKVRWLDLAVDADGAAVAVTDRGIRRLRVSPQRARAAATYAEGLQLMRSGFSELGADTVIQAFRTDPSFIGRNIAYPYLHAWPRLFTQTGEGTVPATPTAAGRLFQAVQQLAAEPVDGQPRDVNYAIYHLAYHGLFALRAGQPGIAHQSLAALRGFVDRAAREGALKYPRRAEVWPDLLEAMILISEGRRDEAYAFLAREGGLVRDGYREAADWTLQWPELFAPLLADRAKVAYLTGRPAHEIPSPGSSTAANTAAVPYPDVNGVLIPPPTGPAVTERPAATAQPVPASPPATAPAAGQVLD